MPANDMLQLYLQARLFLKLALRCLRGMFPPAHKTAGEYQATLGTLEKQITSLVFYNYADTAQRG